MKIYINSRGFAPEYDYRWVEINNNEQISLGEHEQPTLINQFSQLIKLDSFSLVLARSNRELLLVITAMATSRKDFVPRRIRNSIALVARESEEEKLRIIAVNALRGKLNQKGHLECKLSQKLNNFVESAGINGFNVTVSSNKLLAELTAGDTVGNSNPTQKIPVQSFSPENQYELAEELRKNRLPQEQGALVVVSEIVSNTTLENADVWRGLTPNFVSSGIVPKKPQTPPGIEYLIDLIPQLMKIKNLAILIFVVVLMFILSQIGWPPGNNSSQNPQPPIEQTSQAKSEIIAYITSSETQNITIQVNKSLTIEGNFAIPLSSKKKLPTMT